VRVVRKSRGESRRSEVELGEAGSIE
jgi:hypothetical protein